MILPYSVSFRQMCLSKDIKAEANVRHVYYLLHVHDVCTPYIMGCLFFFTVLYAALLFLRSFNYEKHWVLCLTNGSLNKCVLGISGESWSGQVMAFWVCPLDMTSGSDKVTVVYGCPPSSCSVPDNADLIFRKYGSLLGGKDGPGSNPGGDEIFRPSRPALGPIQPPVKWVPCLSRG